jgi:hypothetical protein
MHAYIHLTKLKVSYLTSSSSILNFMSLFWLIFVVSLFSFSSSSERLEELICSWGNVSQCKSDRFPAQISLRKTHTWCVATMISLSVHFVFRRRSVKHVLWWKLSESRASDQIKQLCKHDNWVCVRIKECLYVYHIAFARRFIIRRHRIHACTQTHTDTHRHTQTHTHTDVHVHECMHVHVQTHAYVHTLDLGTQRAYPGIQAFYSGGKNTHCDTHVHACMHTYIYTYTHTYIHTHSPRHTYIHTYTHTHTPPTMVPSTRMTDIHTYIHTYTHTQWS